MAEPDGRTVAVVGATGLQGGAVARALLRRGWHVRALTRAPGGKKARVLAGLGCEVVEAQLDDPDTLTRAFDGAHGVFNVQNHHISGYEGEVAQGRNVTDAALGTGVALVVYGAGGLGGQRTGVGSWDTKLDVAAYMRARGLPVTILRPMAFMELMTDRKFFPSSSTWDMMPRLLGSARPVGWISVTDVARIAAQAFAAPEQFLGRDLPLAADVRSIAECRQLWRETFGRAPRRLPLPVGVFERFVGTDETTMWRWLRDHDIELDTRATRSLLPDALTVADFLRLRRPAAAAGGPLSAAGAS